MAGLRVLRGQDWNHGNEDGGEGHLGTIVTTEGLMAKVVWDNGSRTSCRIGQDGKHDVLVFDNATVGVRHPGVTCCSCEEEDIRGMRWKCATCKKCDLCPICYVRGKHDLSHEFYRFTTSESSGVKVKKRKTCQRIQSAGIFPDATVERGEDWDSENQDGGAGKHGTVRSIQNASDGSTARNMVSVRWDNGNSGVYRVGANGKMDLKFVEECPGTYYYRDHLPIVDVSSSMQVEPHTDSEALEEGDAVFIKLSVAVLKAKQNETSGWTSGMADCIGKMGVIKNITSKGDVMVEFDGLRFRFHPAALKKVPQLSVGDIVQIDDDEEKVKVIQKSNGLWKKNMRHALGKCGKVVKIDPESGVVVAFGETSWVFSPACCIRTPGNVVDDLNTSTSSSTNSSSSDTSPTSSGSGQQEELLKMLAGLLKLRGNLGGGHQADSDDLYVAIIRGDVDVVRTIARKQPNLINERHKGVTPLIIASREGEMEIVKVLLENKARIEADDGQGNTPLCHALNKKKENVAKLLLEHGARADISNGNNVTPLHFATYNNLPDVTKMLIQRGCPVNAKDGDGDTALHNAIQKGYRDAVDVMCRASKLDLTVCNQKGFTPLQFAALRDHSFAVERIIQRDPSTVNIKMATMLFTALHIAANNDHVKCARLLIVQGKASLDENDQNKMTALHLACNKGHFDTVELLLEKGANVNVKNLIGNTPLHVAMATIEDNKDLLARLLAQQSGDDEDEARVRIACLLIQKGASYNVTNLKGETPVEAAKNRRIRRGVQQYIESKGGSCRSGRSSPTLGQGPLKLPCAKCMEKLSVITTTPCGHKVLCRECCLKVQRCPICEKTIERRIASSKEEELELPCKVQ